MSDYPIIWEVPEQRPNTQEERLAGSMDAGIVDRLVKNLEEAITWTIKAIPGPVDETDSGSSDPEPVITAYEIIEHDLNPDTVIVPANADIDPRVGVVITGNAGNPFRFEKIGYVSPKNKGSEQTFVKAVSDLPDYKTIDLFAFIPSAEDLHKNTITIKALAPDAKVPEITGRFQLVTINNWDKVSDTLQRIVNS